MDSSSCRSLKNIFYFKWIILEFCHLTSAPVGALEDKLNALLGKYDNRLTDRDGQAKNKVILQNGVNWEIEFVGVQFYKEM